MENGTKIGERIKILREASGTTQQALADALHVKRETINMWENGGRDLKTGSICDLANYFDVSADYLLGRSNCKSADIPVQSICKMTGLSEDAINILMECQEACAGVPIANLKNFPLAYASVKPRPNPSHTLIESNQYLTFLDYFIRHWGSKQMALTVNHLAVSLTDKLSTEELHKKYSRIVEAEDILSLIGNRDRADMFEYRLSVFWGLILHDIVALYASQEYYVTPTEAAKSFRGSDTHGKT